jgi:aryl-alcohol dehydrogenase-like predicted oxidoreductase
VPFAEQLDAIAAMQREGLIRHIGLSNVSVAQIDEAVARVAIASVQHTYNVIDRRHEDVLERCERDGIPFIAYYPLATGALAFPDSVLARAAGKLGITPAQAALAWLLKRSPVIVAIPGTQDPAHFRENVAAAQVELTDEQFAELEKIGKRAAMMRGVSEA